jgi:hypothetical protein
VAIDRERARQYLKAFDFRRLFLDQLGWDKHTSVLEKVVDGRHYRFQAAAEKRGVVALVSDSIPDYATRVKLDRLVAKDHFQHLLIFADRSAERQVWQWVRRESLRPLAIRAYTYAGNNSGELLLQKLDHLVFSIDEEDALRHGHVVSRMDDVARVDRVTKKFYERFKTEHDRFLKFIEGIPDGEMEKWYASVMINRLMFLSFIQAKSFLNGDQDYLRSKLKESRNRKKDGYYPDFLCSLFFEGFARKKEERSPTVNKLLGTVPYLNGGLFQRHQIEELHGKTIEIADAAFEHLFEFFKEYDWHLDERENRSNDREINPDVLGYIFEKYINQKQMGAYYTKEDITGYITQNTVVPFVLDAARKDCTVAFDKASAVWRLLQDDPDRYIYAAVRHGAGLELPSDIAVGLSSVSKRSGWNKPAPPDYALPTEIWREVVERRRRYEEVRGKLTKGEVSEVNDLITLNLDVRQFAQDVIQFCEGPELLRAMYKAISKASVLDPACGSGAFIFAALNILKPLYEACLQRMQMFVDELDAGPAHDPKKFEDFRRILDDSKQHPKQDYFILKSIIVNNLYGVDLMEEAVEICKLRLFLKLVAQVDSQDRIEPLPDIDFNIRAGNTLVGYARYSDVEKAVGSKLDFEDAMGRIEDKAKKIDSAVEMFRRQQTRLHGTVSPEDKLALRARFGELEEELDDILSAEYGVKKAGVREWKQTHKPFHWFSDFHRIMSAGGFDAIIGNPPYVEYREVLPNYALRPGSFATMECGNLYAFFYERCLALQHPAGRIGLIIPVASVSTDGYESLRKQLLSRGAIVASSFNDRPSKLFDGLEHIRLSIILHRRQQSPAVFTTRYNRWAKQERPRLFPSLQFSDSTKDVAPGWIPKFGSSAERCIYEKMTSRCPKPLGSFFVRAGETTIYYTRKLSHFVQVLDFVPRMLDDRRKERQPSELKALQLATRLHGAAALAALNSSLFYWYLNVVSDCRNLNRREFDLFPLDLSTLTKDTTAVLGRLASQLMEDFSANSKLVEMNYSQHGRMQIQCVYPRYSKAIIDRIDEALARHYALNDDELDLIVNYDIKYRLGADADAE